MYTIDLRYEDKIIAVKKALDNPFLNTYSLKFATVNIKDLVTPGIYFLEIHSGNEIINEKIVIGS